VPDLVSILIPAFNAEKWIKQTIESAMDQTWPDKEIIVVDDGSIDNTLKIAKAYESDSIRIVTQANKGASAARNNAYKLAKGGYIQWLDADDLLAPDKIAKQMKAAEFVSSRLVVFSGTHGVFYHRLKKAAFFPNALWQDLSPLDWLMLNTSLNIWLSPAVWLVSRSMTEKAGPWDERLSMDDDGEYFARVVAASDDVRFIRESKCFYRQSSFRQVSRDFSEKALESLFLSATMRIRALLSLEESERTRGAGVQMLQGIFKVFYPDRIDLVRRIRALAGELGGELAPPRLGWRATLLQRYLGPRRGKKLMSSLRSLRMQAAVNWDKLLGLIGL
jgi:glycosyltransferase involved in cell wall biosynthesis